MKKLLAIAVAAGLAAPMAVMADTTVYGKIVMSVGSDDNGSGDSVTSVKSGSSRIGLKGSMPLDNGMTITHKVEMGTHQLLDNSTNGLGSGTLTARDTWVGLKGNFGEVRTGRHATPMNLVGDALDIMNYGGQSTFDEGLAGFRTNNVVAYLNSFGPVAFAGAYVPLENADNDKAIDVMLAYKQNGIYAAVGHQKVDNFDATTSLAGSYTFPAGHMVGISHVNNKETDNKSTAYVGKYKFGKAYVQGEITKRKDHDGSAKVIEMGYDLGSKTTIWGSLGDGDVDNVDTSHARVGVTTWF